MIANDLIGQTLGEYTLRAIAGAGGMAVVYQAHQAGLDRLVALKVLRPARSADDPAARNRFLQEARSAARLAHPQIVPVYATGTAHGLHFIAMQYLGGGTLADYRGPQSLATSLALLAPIAAALDYAHDQGLVHGDVKPANILLDESGRPYLSDFGLARAAHATIPERGDTIFATPAYMAPEQAQAGAADPRSDHYALGVVAYELLTGALPFAAETPDEQFAARLLGPPRDPRSLRPDLPPAVAAALLQALAHNPADRFQRAAAFITALRTAAELTPQQHTPVQLARPPASAPTIALRSAAPPRQRLHRRRAPAAVFGAAFLAAALVAGVLGQRNLQPHPPPDPIVRVVTVTPLVQQVPAIDGELAAGARLLAAGHYRQARERFAAVLALDPASAPAQAGLGWVAYEEEDAAEAAERFAAALRLDDQLFDALHGQAWLLFGAEDYTDAAAAFDAALAVNPASAAAHNGRGWSLYNMGRNREAAVAFRRAIELDPTYANAYEGLSQALEQLGDGAGARAAAQTARKLIP